ncbi:maltose alpha-D-glucosyltransferase [Oxalobacteraceae bacterium CAVE-383]|nr:maltose alpha-D-glucosyltransferase [Oxalobacteraceae bacterium CAVE-383]
MSEKKTSAEQKGNGRRAKNKARSDFIADPLWYKDAVVYQIHVKSYFDSNNDGVGDFAGLIDKLDYIAGLGVNTIWLLPFYPSPRRDDGYDIADYRGVHPDYGTLSDARRFIAEAHERGLRVITELVINHTSDQHPWFIKARSSKPGSAARDFYVWADNDAGYHGTRIIFNDTEKSNWTWDPVANAYFWHRFFSHQPDLNFDNPQVLKAVLGVMAFWLDLGIDGLRLDAVPYLIEREGTSNENLPETHAILKKIRAELDFKYPDRMLLAEANMWPEDVQQYFGDGDECHMAFHFPLMPRMYMALAQQDRFPITDILRQTPEIPADCQWAIFLRNHDELTLEMVTDLERDYLWNFYAADRRARINMGIRRRLAPLLERDSRRIQLLNSFLLSMPGTPVIYYGDEIGMGDNIHLGDRDGVRTPMQWTLDRNGGFSRADPASLVLPPIMDTLYGYQSINVEAQSSDRHSLLNWTRRMLDVRKQHKAFGRGTLTVLYPSNRKIFAYLREYADPHKAVDGDGVVETILCVANVSPSAQAVELDLSRFAGRIPVEMIGGTAFPPMGQLNYLLTLPPYGFYWFVLATEATMPTWYTPTPQPLPEYATLVLRNGVEDIMKNPARHILESEALPAYVMKRRWYGAKNRKLQSINIAVAVTLPPSKLSPGALPILMTEIETHTSHGVSRYQLPLGFIREEDTVTALPHQLALARVRRNNRVGLLTDAFTLDSFASVVLELLRENTVLPTPQGDIHFMAAPSATPEQLAVGVDAGVRRIAAEQSNSSLVIGDKVMLKIIRHLSAGIHPEIEMGMYLTAGGYASTPATLGEVTRTAADGTPTALIVLQQFVHNQGDAWQWTIDALERAIQQDVLTGPADSAPAQGTAAASHAHAHAPAPAAASIAHAHAENVEMADDPLHELTQFAQTLGQRLGQMHALLGAPTGNQAFAPEAVTAAHSKAWAKRATEQLEAALDVLAQQKEWNKPADEALAQALLAHRKALPAVLERLAAAGIGSASIRIHGDLHLGQVLVSGHEIYIVDFEGEPAAPLAARRAKQSPLRDVAGVLRSFDYAAAHAANIGPGDLGQAAQARKQATLERFAPACQQAFLAGYHSIEGAHLSGLSPQQQSDLLDLLTLEKAAYEICYEAANRPAWIAVPLHGLAAIAQRLVGVGAGASARHKKTEKGNTDE